MTLRPQTEVSAHSFGDCREFGHVDIHHFSGVEPDERVAGALAVRQLILGLVALGEHALDDPGVLEEVDGPVDGRLADAMPSLAQFLDDLLGLKDLVQRDNRVENLGSLRGVLLALGFELPAEDRAQGRGDADAGKALIAANGAGSGWNTACAARVE